MDTHPGEFNSPSGIAVDPQGFVYVADAGNNRIQKFNANGRFNKSMGIVGDGPGQFDSPNGIAVDHNGFVFVADGKNHRLQKFSSNGTYITQWGQYTEGRNKDSTQFGKKNVGVQSDTTFLHPSSVDTDLTGQVYVADRGNNRIQKFDSNGKFLGEWGSSGTHPGEFNSPSGIAVDSPSFVYVADTGNNRIQKFDFNAKFLGEWGSFGTHPGEFNCPQALR